jgi:hypothetical protein
MIIETNQLASINLKKTALITGLSPTVHYHQK